MAAKIDSEKGRRIYNPRIAIAEPVLRKFVSVSNESVSLRGKILATLGTVFSAMTLTFLSLSPYGDWKPSRSRGPQPSASVTNRRPFA